jgi:dihydrofolate synthase/folylpolyglutamate synthase
VIAFDLFRAADVEVAVLEVGLGGRLDATNVVTPVLSAITSIDFDHEALLGTTLAAIAFEKAGVIRPRIPVVTGTLPEEAMRVVTAVCAERGAFLRAVDGHGFAAVDRITGGAALALAGAHQRANAAVAVAVLQELDRLGIRVSTGDIRRGLCDVEWPARLERLRRGECEVLLDAAHNPAGARALADYLQSIGWTGVPLVFAAMQDKHVLDMVAPLARVVGRIICTTAPTPRTLSAEALAAAARAIAPWLPVDPIADPRVGLECACRLSKRVVAAGSIFLVGPLRGILRS